MFGSERFHLLLSPKNWCVLKKLNEIKDLLYYSKLILGEKTPFPPNPKYLQKLYDTNCIEVIAKLQFHENEKIYLLAKSIIETFAPQFLILDIDKTRKNIEILEFNKKYKILKSFEYEEDKVTKCVSPILASIFKHLPNELSFTIRIDPFHVISEKRKISAIYLELLQNTTIKLRKSIFDLSLKQIDQVIRSIYEIAHSSDSNLKIRIHVYFDKSIEISKNQTFEIDFKETNEFFVPDDQWQTIKDYDNEPEKYTINELVASVKYY